jgi:hypothetical protein
MVRNEEQKYISENYVSIPPALIITDEAGAIWTLGFIVGPVSGGEFTFNVLRNGVDTGEFANRIERRKNEIWIYGDEGWKRMHVRESEPTYVYAIKAMLKVHPFKPEPIVVDIYWDDKPEMPVISFAGNAALGLVYNTLPDPIECLPNQWLDAIINPRLDVSVTAYVGGENLRAIPIRRGVSV